MRIHPNYEDEMKIKHYFKIKDIQNISEDFSETFEPEGKQAGIDEVMKLKDLLIEEKDKRIQNLEETIHILMDAQAEPQKKKKS